MKKQWDPSVSMKMFSVYSYLFQFDISVVDHGNTGSGTRCHQHSLDTVTALQGLIHYSLERNGLATSDSLICSNNCLSLSCIT